MIHQFVEIGDFYQNAEGVKSDLALYAQDPEQVFQSKTVLVMVFSEAGYERIQVEEYDPDHRLWYLFRPGPSNGFEPTGTSAMPRWNPKQAGDYEKQVRTKLKRLKKSAKSAHEISVAVEQWETEALRAFDNVEASVDRIFHDVAVSQPDPKGGGILTLSWKTTDGELKRVGDFKSFQCSLIKAGRNSASTMKTVGESSGTGQRCICGCTELKVSGLLRIEPFKFYTVDKPGAVSGGFDPSQAWRNFPVCASCAQRAQFSGERLRKNLTFDYYGFQYLVLPSVIQPNPTSVHQLIDRLCRARVNKSSAARLTDAEDELLWVVAEEQNVAQLDLLFFDPRGRSFRPALYLSGLLPSQFRALFAARDRVDAHPWVDPGIKGSLSSKPYSFGILKCVLADSDALFFEATRAALTRTNFGERTLIHFGMQLARQDFVEGAKWRERIGALFASLLFFSELTSSSKGGNCVTVQFGISPQAERVRCVFSESGGLLAGNPEAQATFLTGACCKRVEHIQEHQLGSAPFREKYKGLRLSQKDIRQLFVEASSKARSYEGQEHIVSGLLECAAEAYRVCSDAWSLAPDEVAFYFALGLALAGRFAKGPEEEENTSGSHATAAIGQ